jgi:tetratricopeptide (TPR) repeat protein
MTGTNADMDAVIRALAVLDAEPDNREALAILDQASARAASDTGNGHAQAAGGSAVPAHALRAVADARRVHRERGDFELVAKLLDCELAWLPADAKPEVTTRRADLLVERGKLFADELLDDVEAVRSLERVLQLRPGDATAEETLSHIALVRDNWQKIVKKYLEEAKESTDRALTTSLYLSVAELYAKYGGAEGKKHVEAYLRQALEVEPRNGKASMRLERIYQREARWEELRALYEARIEAAATKEERVAAYLALADVEARRLSRPNEAAEAYKKALGIDPGNQRALAALVEHYTAAENWQALIRVYENALRVRPRTDVRGSSSGPAGAAAPSVIDLSETAMLLQIAMLWWKKLGNLEAADEYWKRVRKSEPAHPAMLDFYREYHAKEPGKLLPILQQAQKLEADARRRLELATEMARLSEKVPGGTEKAIDLWKSVLKQDPRADYAGEALQRLYQQTEKWNALLELLKERMEALPKDAVDERVARLLEVVAIYRDRLNLDVMVINTYNHILQLRPDHPIALGALAQKYESMGRWNDLIGVLQRTADVSTDRAERARLLKRIAGLWLEKFSNVNQAVKPLEELYALDPADADTVARLRDIYGRRRAWRALVDLERKELERLKPADGAPPEAREAFRQKAIEIAKLAADRLGDPREAIVLWNRLLELDEHDPDALPALAQLYEREKRWAPLVEVLRRQVERGTGDAKRDLQLLERIGAIWIDRLQAPEQAIRAWQEILKRNPSHPKAMRTLRELYAQGGRFDDLERLYGEQGQWEELCDVLLGVVERMGDATKEGGDGDDVKAVRVRLCLRVAELAVEKLRSTERAAKAYERVLAIDPQHAGAARALIPIYRGGEKWARLLASYEILLAHVPPGAAGDEERLSIFDEVVRLCEEKLGSKGLAFTWAARAYAVRPTDERRGAELERLAADAEAWDELADIYTAEVAAAGNEASDARTIDRIRKLGRIARERQHLPDEARKWFERLLALRPDDEEALGTLEAIFTQGEMFVELLGIYRRRADAAPATGAQVGRRIDLLFKIEWIEEEKLGQLDAAAATLRRIVELAVKEGVRPAHERALRGLEKLHRDRADWRALAEVLEQQKALAAGDVDAQVALEVQLGELFETRLHDRDAALARYKAAFALEPAHRPTQTALERWLAPEANPAHRVDVAALLAPVYEGRGDQTKLVGALEVLLAATPTEDRARRLQLARRVMSLLIPAGGAAELDPGSERARRAYDHALAIFALEPTDAINRQLLSDLAERLECPDDLAVRLGAAEQAAAEAGNVTLARDLAWDLGRLFADRLGMPGDAEEAYRRVLARDPGHAGADVALVTLLSSNEKWPALRAFLAEKAERALSPSEKMGLLFRVAELDEGVLGNDDAAIADYAAVLAIDPAGPEAARAARALDRLYTEKERWRDLDALLEARVPYAAPGGDGVDSRGHLLARRGELAMTRLDQPARAAELFEQAILDDPKHEVARRGLETLMKRPELRQRIARALEPLYEREEAWPKLALVLGAQREAPELREPRDPVRAGEALALAVRLAEIQEQRLGARQLALATWREALRLAPSEIKVRENVERLCTLLSRPADLAAAWEEALLVSDPADLALRAELLEKAAGIYEEELRDRERAKQAWRRLLELDPTNVQTSRPAAIALARLYEAEESWPGLIEVLHRQADWADAPSEKKELLFRIGRIQEELTVDPKAAVATYREILEVDPEERGALDALERLHNAEGAWPELVDILKRRLDLERDPAARRDLAWRLAQISERELKDGTQAIAWYHAILDERPDDLPALDALARLFENAGRTVDLLDVLERQLVIIDAKEQARGPSSALMPQRVALRMRVGTLQAQLGRREQALERFREVLDEDFRHEGARAGLEALTTDEDLRLRAAEVLEPCYERAGELDKLIKISELFAEHAPDPRERIARLRKIAELQKGAKSAEGSFGALSRAARYAVGEPELPGLLDGLERVAAEAGRRAELVALYREIGPDILDATTQERVYLTIAAESHRLGDRPTAREYYRRVLDSSPEHPRALDALESIYLEARELEPLFEIYARRAELFGQAGDAERQRQYLISLASLCEGELARPTEAIRAWEQVLELFPADSDAAKALEGHYTAEKRWTDLADLVEKRLGFADDLDEAVSLRFRLAQIYDHELRDSDRAVENYRAALGGDPTHAGAIAALERYLDDEMQRVSAAEVLEPVYASRHEWQKLARIYEIRLEAADDARLRLGLVRRIARLYEEQLEDLDGAFRWYGRLFREDPADRNVRDQLARLAGILGAWEALARLYEEWLRDSPEASDAALGAEVLRALASIYHTRLNDVDGAKSAYVRLLSIDNSDELAFVNLEKLLTGAARWRDLIEVWRDAADATLDMDRRKALLFKQAAVEETELAAPEAAIDRYRAVLDVDPEDPKAIAALDRLYSSGKRWHDLVELIQRRLERADGPAWIALKLRLGGLYETELEDRASAIDAYEEVLGRSPGHPDAVRALERLIVDNDHTFRIAQILEPIYREQDAWQKLVVIYDAELEYIDDKPRRIELLREIARIHETRGGDRRLGFQALARALGELVREAGSVDEEAEVYADLERLARAEGAFGDLVSAVHAAIEGSYDAELLARMHARVARVRDVELRDVAGAIESWRKVVAARDDAGDAWKALERLLEAAGRAEELVAVLEKRATLEDDAGAQKELLARAAALYDGRLGQPEQAIAAWRQVLTIDDGDPRALDALERLYAARGAHRDLAAIYSRKIELAVDDGERRRLRLLLAKLSERDLEDSFAAIDALKGILEANPADREALSELARLYEGEGLWADHLEALDALTRSTELSPEERVEVAFRAAIVVEQKMSEAEPAIRRYAEVLAAIPPRIGGPFHAGARAALERLLREPDTLQPAAAVLEPFYQARAEFAPLVELTELKLAAESDPVERRQLFARLAELNEAGLEDLQGAFAAWGRALAEEPGDAAIQAELERLAEVGQAFAELARLYEERLAGSFDPDVQRVLAWKLGVLYETRLGDDERAISAYRKALELASGPIGFDDVDGGAGSDRACLSALDRLLLRGSRWRDLAEVLEREAQAVVDPAAQAELYHRLGAIRAGELVDLDGALAAFREALTREPKHAAARAGLEALTRSSLHAEQALDLLEPLYEDDGDHRKLLELAEIRLGITHHRGDRVALLERMAERARERLGDAAGALAAMGRALETDPTEARLADEVQRLAVEAGDELAAAAIFDGVLAGPSRGEPGLSPEVERELALRAGRLYEQHQDPRAEERYRTVLEAGGGGGPGEAERGEALSALERLYRGRGDGARLVEILERRAEVELDIGEKKRLLTEAATIRQTFDPQTSSSEEAVAAWRKVLAVDEADATALDALAALYERAGSWRELVEVLEERARFSEVPAEQAQLKGRIGQLYAERLEELDKAAQVYRDLVDLEPDSLAALEALEQVERRRGDPAAVQEVLVRRLQAVGAGAGQIPVYLQLADLALSTAGKEASPEDAIGYLHEVLTLAPGHGQATERLLALLEENGKYHDLVDVLTQEANRRGQAGDAAGEVALLVRVADVWEGRLGSPESATEILERILARDPTSVRALASLARIYESAGESDKCRETLARALPLAKTGEEQAELHFRIGRLDAQEGGDAAGEAAYRRALAAWPQHKGAREGLEAIARGRGAWDEVVELLRLREAEVAGDEAAARALYVELAQILLGKLGRPGDALPWLERARALAPDEPTVLEPLGDLYFAAGRLDDALPIYRALAERMQKARKMKDVARLRSRVGAIAEARGDVKLAQAEYAAAHQIDPAHGPTMAALGRLHMAAGEWEKARGLYRKMLLQNLDPAGGVTKADVYLALGEIHEKLNEGPKAIGMYERGLEVDAGHEKLREALARLRRAGG